MPNKPNKRVRLLFSNAPYKIGDRTTRSAIALEVLNGVRAFTGCQDKAIAAIAPIQSVVARATPQHIIPIAAD